MSIGKEKIRHISLETLVSYLTKPKKKQNSGSDSASPTTSEFNNQDTNKFDYREKEVNEENKEKDNKYKPLLPDETEYAIKFPKAFRNEIFKKYQQKVYRMGIQQIGIKNKVYRNISLYHSIAVCLKTNFSNLTNDEQIDYVDAMRNKISYDFVRGNFFRKFNYNELNWKKGQLLSDIKNYVNSEMVIRYLADYFDINIFVFDFLDDDIHLYYGKSQSLKVYLPPLPISIKTPIETKTTGDKKIDGTEKNK